MDADLWLAGVVPKQAKALNGIRVNQGVELSELKCTGNSCCVLMRSSRVFSEQKLQFCQSIL